MQQFRQHYLYDGGVLIATFDARDSVLQMYVNGRDGQPVAVYDQNGAVANNKLYYFLKDQVGSTRALVKNSGQVMEYVNYHPFGEIAQSWASYDEPMKFTGHERDTFQTMGYTYFGARYYDPELGQFTSIDKAAQFAGGFNYCGNNPIVYIDKDGNFAWFIPVIVGAVLNATVYSATTDDWKFNEFVGQTVIGGAAGLVGGQLCAYSALAASAGSSFTSSTLSSIMFGTDPYMSIGPLQMDMDGMRLNYPGRRGGFLANLGATMEWLAVGEDAGKIVRSAVKTGDTYEDALRRQNESGTIDRGIDLTKYNPSKVDPLIRRMAFEPYTGKHVGFPELSLMEGYERASDIRFVDGLHLENVKTSQELNPLVAHRDFYAGFTGNLFKGNLQNWTTGAYHILFEANPLTDYAGSIPYAGQYLRAIPYTYYITQPIYGKY